MRRWPGGEGFTSALGAQGGAAQDQQEFARRTADTQESMVQSYQREARPTVDGIATLPPGVGESVFGELYAPGQQSPQAGNMFGGGTQALLGQLPESDTARSIRQNTEALEEYRQLTGDQGLGAGVFNGESGPTGPAGMRGSGEFFEGRNVTPSPSPAVIGQRLGNVSMPASQDPTAVAIAESQANIARMGRQAGQGLTGGFRPQDVPGGAPTFTVPTSVSGMPEDVSGGARTVTIPSQDGRAIRPFEGPTGGFTLPPQSMAGPQNQITQDAVAALLGGLRARNPHSSPEQIAQLAIQQGAPPELVEVDARERALRATQLSPLQAAMKEFPLQAPGAQGGGGGVLPMQGTDPVTKLALLDAEQKRKDADQRRKLVAGELRKMSADEKKLNPPPAVAGVTQQIENDFEAVEAPGLFTRIAKIAIHMGTAGAITSISDLGAPDATKAEWMADAIIKRLEGMSPEDRAAAFRDSAILKKIQENRSALIKTMDRWENSDSYSRTRAAFDKMIAAMTGN